MLVMVVVLVVVVAVLTFTLSSLSLFFPPPSLALSRAAVYLEKKGGLEVPGGRFGAFYAGAAGRLLRGLYVRNSRRALCRSEAWVVPQVLVGVGVGIEILGWWWWWWL